MTEGDTFYNYASVENMLDGFNWHLRPRRQEILNSFNQALIKLYAEIGKICTGYLEQRRSVTLNEGLQELSDQLIPVYGEIFNPSQLKLMMLLAPHYDLPFTRASLPSALSWEMLSVILPINDVQEQEFYRRAAIAENWSLQQLTQYKEQNTYHNHKLFKTLRARIARYGLSSGKQKNLLEKQLKITPSLEDYLKRRYTNPFTEPLQTIYKPLLQPQPYEPTYTHRQLRDALSQNDAQGVMAQIIQFREDVSRHLNSIFTETYRIAGDNLNFNKHHDTSLFAEFVKTVKLQHSQLFKDDDTEKAMQLDNYSKEFGEMTYVAHLVSWPHIKLLLMIKDIEEIVFYADLTSKKDLTVDELKECIEAKVYAELNREGQQNSILKNYADADPANLIRQVHYQETIAAGKSTVKVMSTYLHKDETYQIHHHLNILQNPYFMQFMAAIIA
jgi:predicted nuclease of restriction endonuclease-like (RecB) superfamily